MISILLIIKWQYIIRLWRRQLLLMQSFIEVGVAIATLNVIYIIKRRCIINGLLQIKQELK